MFNYNDIVEYIDGTYDTHFNEAHKWCKDNNATFDELIEERKEVEIEKTRTVESFEEQIIPAVYDADGNLIEEERIEIVPVAKEETYTETELHRFFKINEIPVPVVPEPTFEELKLAKRAEINQARDTAEQSGFEYLGKRFDSDPISCQRISCAAQAMSMVTMSEEVPTITWTCQDNTTIDLNPQELMGLVVALAQWSNTCHQKATALKEKIELCTSKEELDKIVWE